MRAKGFYTLATVEQALKLLLSNVKIVSKEQIKLENALGRILAEDIKAEEDVPPFDRAAMDGYALKGENTSGASETAPIYFKIVTGEVKDFEAAKITTGSPIPRGANAVVMVEYTNRLDGEIEVLKSVPPGKNVSYHGEDVKKGEVILKKGKRIKPQDIAILAAIGRTKIQVYKKPVVGIISTGDELEKPGKKLARSKIYDSNSYALSALVEMNGGIPKNIGIVKDEYQKLKSAIKKALAYDTVLLSGATALGEKDLVPLAVSKIGRILIHGVSMRPGKPFGFGISGDKIIFMLPGSPVAAIVAFETFVRPVLQKMQNEDVHNPYPQVSAVLKRKIPSEIGRRDFVRVKLTSEKGKLFAEPISTSGAGIISTLVKADGIVVVPENLEGYEKGEKITVNVL